MNKSPQVRGRGFFDPAETDDLPAELLAEIQPNKKQQRVAQVVEVFRQGGGTLTVSEVLVGLYRVHNIVGTRAKTYSLLYRMQQQGVISKTRKKGEYSLFPSIEDVSDGGA